MTTPFRIEALSAAHDRSSFTSGEDSLDRYFQNQVTQDIRRHITSCFVALDKSTSEVAGYYTLAASSVALSNVPPELRRGLPRYPSVPVARLGRLAVSIRYQGRGLGSALLADAGIRSLRSEIAIFALVVDAKNETAEAFYRHHGFMPYGADQRQFMISLQTMVRTS